MFIENRIIMEYIEKRDGYVYLVQENDSQGRFNTYYNLGKDPDDPRWEEQEEKHKQKKGRTKKDEL